MSRAHLDVSTCLEHISTPLLVEHMDVRAGLKDHHASPAGAVTREKKFKGQRDAKKKAYAAAEPVRAARAAEEQALAKARAEEKQARAEVRAAEEKARAERRRAAAERRATVVPPEPGSTKHFVNVSFETGPGLWKAEYNDEKPSRERRTRRTLGYYATAQLAARARHKHICDEGFEQFNTMDVLDDATDLMVPRERKKPPKKKKRPPPATFDVVDGSESRSGRVRKATKR